jgi:hypothetical protein
VRNKIAAGYPGAAGLPAVAAPTEAASTGVIAAWTRFWFSAVDPIGLHWVRVLAGLLFLAWLLPLTGERHALFGLDGYFDATAYREASRLPPDTYMPFGWSLLYVFGKSATLLDTFWWGSLAVLTLFTLGIATRVTGVLTWLIIVSFLASPVAQPDTDYLLVVPAFYLMIAYLLYGQWNRRLSLLERAFGPRGTAVFAGFFRKQEEPQPSYAANLAIRLLQVHFVIMIVTSGLHKLQFGDWWAGAAYWYPMHPPMSMDAAKLAAARVHGDMTLFVLSVAGYLALTWQITFPVFAFRKRFRGLLLAGGLIGWLGAAFLYGEPTFGPLFFLACLTYLTPGEWRWLTERVAALVERRAAAQTERTTAPHMARVKASI